MSSFPQQHELEPGERGFIHNDKSSSTYMPNKSDLNSSSQSLKQPVKDESTPDRMYGASLLQSLFTSGKRLKEGDSNQSQCSSNSCSGLNIVRDSAQNPNTTLQINPSSQKKSNDNISYRNATPMSVPSQFKPNTSEDKQMINHRQNKTYAINNLPTWIRKESIPSSHISSSASPLTCTCKKSKCLKLYW